MDVNLAVAVHVGFEDDVVVGIVVWIIILFGFGEEFEAHVPGGAVGVFDFLWGYGLVA